MIVLLELKCETIDTTIVAVVQCIQEVPTLDQEETTLSTKKAKFRHIRTVTESFKYLSFHSENGLVGLIYFLIRCFGSHHYRISCSDHTIEAKTWKVLILETSNALTDWGHRKSCCITVMMNSA